MGLPPWASTRPLRTLGTSRTSRLRRPATGTCCGVNPSTATETTGSGGSLSSENEPAGPVVAVRVRDEAGPATPPGLAGPPAPEGAAPCVACPDCTATTTPGMGAPEY